MGGAFYPTSATKKAELQRWLQRHHSKEYQEAQYTAWTLDARRSLLSRKREQA